MRLSRNTLLVDLRFLDMALSRLDLIPAPGVGLATQGEHVLFDPVFVLRRYKQAQQIPVRDYLHIVMHCVFRHMYCDPTLNRQYWDVACDIAVENVITELGLNCVRTDNELRQRPVTDAIRAGLKHVTAEKIYHLLRTNYPDPRKLAEIAALFRSDDHALWYMPDPEIEGRFGVSLNPSGKPEQQRSDDDDKNGSGEADGEGEGSSANGEGDEGSGSGGESDSQQAMSSRALAAEDWQTISERMQIDIETFGKQRGVGAGALSQNLKEVNREKYDYTSFLKKFAVLGEAMKINDDEFDYIFYTYGLKLYEKMPLIEPLEYKEVKRIKEFVIAIDTSGSTSGELVQKFLQKTYNILLETESFFTKINVHIIQCDAEIQEDAKITSREEFDEYIKHMQIRGLGGTDFRPVFQYVDELTRAREFTNLKGLIYFTDGFGVFPEQKPPYDTAFVFMDDEINNYNVPPWAIKLVLRDNEI